MSLEKPSSEILNTESAFRSLLFTQTSGYGHYAPAIVDTDRHALSVETFLNDPEVLEPHMGLSYHSWETINQAIKEYDRLLTDLAKKHIRTLEEDALMDRIINKTSELFRYEELLLAIGSTALSEQNEHRRLAADLSLEIMGGINVAVFNVLSDDLLDMADESKQSVADELKGLIKRSETSSANSFSSVELEDTTRETIKGDLYELYPGLRELMEIENNEPVNPAEMVEIVKQLQRLAGLDQWTSRLRDGKSANTSSKDKTVFIGRDRKPLDNHQDAVALGFHEAIVHGGRAAGVQCANTLDFEEGLSTRLQQILSGEKRTPGVQYYLSIGLQAGVDRGGLVRSYRETFEIMWRREVVLQEKSGKKIDTLAARALAQRQVSRTRRGGAIDTRDSSYFIGAQKAAQWLNELALMPRAERSKSLRQVLVNRIDPTIPEHIEMLHEI